MTMSIDPAVQLTIRWALSLLFLWAAGHKLRDFPGFAQTLRDYRLLPASLAPAAAACVIGLELAIAGALPLGPASPPALGAALLLATYGGAIAINLFRGRRHIDCGCAGPARRQPLSPALVVRNAVLCGGALCASLPPSPRALTWIDAVTAVAAVAFLGVGYAIVDGLLANAPRLRLLATGGAQAPEPPSPRAQGAAMGGVVS